MSLRIALVAEDRELRQALRTLLDRERDVVVVGEGGSDDAHRLALARPQVAVVDCELRGRDAYEVAGVLGGRRCRARVLMLAGRPSIDALQAATAAGAAGVAGKMQPARELVGAIRAVGQGASYICPDLVTRALANAELCARLDAREHAIYERLLDGRGDDAIARDLGLSLAAVRAARRRVMDKLGARSPVELLRLAIEPGARAAGTALR